MPHNSLQVLCQPQGHALQPLYRVGFGDVGNEEEDVELAEDQVEKRKDAEENAPGAIGGLRNQTLK